MTVTVSYWILIVSFFLLLNAVLTASPVSLPASEEATQRGRNTRGNSRDGRGEVILVEGRHKKELFNLRSTNVLSFEAGWWHVCYIQNRHFTAQRHSTPLQGISPSAINAAKVTLKHKQCSIAENPGGMFNKPYRFMNEGNYISSVDYLLYHKHSLG